MSLPEDAPTPHDSLFKLAFHQPKDAADELRLLLPAALARRIDWKSLRVETGSFVTERLRLQQSDVLYSVRITGHKTRLYLLVEHKSKADWLTVFQMLRYIVRFWEYWLDLHPEARSLPAVLPILVQHDARGWRAPLALLDLIDLEPELKTAAAEFMLQLRLLLHDLIVETWTTLSVKVSSPVMKVVLLCLAWARRRGFSGELQQAAVTMCALWRVRRRVYEGVLRYVEQVGKIGTRSLRELLASGVGPAAEESFMATIQQEIEKKAAKLAAKLAAELAAKARAEMLLKQLTIRFGALSEEVTAKVSRAEPEQLDVWAERILSATSLGGVLDDL